MRFTHDSLCPLANVSQDGHGLSLVAANCPGDGKKPKRHDRLTRLAGSYNSEQCKAAILAEDLSRWLQNNANKSEFRGVEVIAVSTRPDHCSVAYVRNLKAGSDAIIKRHHDLLPDEYSSDKGGLKLNRCGRGQNCYFDRKPFRWTMVRDPMRRALSAYGQIYGTESPQRIHGFGFEDALTRKAGLGGKCRSRTNTLRYSRFLEAVIRGQPFAELQHDGRHLWPQALLLGLSGRLHMKEGPARVRVLDAIGLLEQADADFSLLRSTMTHDHSKKNVRDELYHNATRERGGHQQTARNPCLRSIDYSHPRLQRALCELYRVDYACFPVYQRPVWCPANASFPRRATALIQETASIPALHRLTRRDMLRPPRPDPRVPRGRRRDDDHDVLSVGLTGKRKPILSRLEP